MDSAAWKEIVGYAASVAVIVSLTMKSILRLRLIGLVGSVAFLVYGVLIGSVPIAITNGVIIAIHLYFLRRLLRVQHEVFATLVVRPDSLYLERFLEFHSGQIERFQPGFEYRHTAETTPIFILRDMVPAGLLIVVPHDDDSLEVLLDYATPQYRDFKLGQFVYSDESGIFGHPVCAWSELWSEEHTSYLERMGFAATKRYDRDVLERALGG